MKKVVRLIIMLCCICSFQVTYAEFDKRVDSFDETIRFYSVNQNVNDFVQLNFYKSFSKDRNEYYRIYAATHFLKKYDFSKDYAELKIDGNIYKVYVIKTEDYKHSNNGLYSISLTVEIPNEIIDDLLASNKVSLRFHRENGWEDIVDLPDKVLNEWKQVIAMEE